MRIEAAQRAPEGYPLAPRAEIPKRDVDGRNREHLRAAATAVVERPPHGLPDLLDALGLAAGQQRSQVARDESVHGRASRPDRVGVADPHRTVGVV